VTLLEGEGASFGWNWFFVEWGTFVMKVLDGGDF
jgi:hypothetical protein